MFSCSQVGKEFDMGIWLKGGLDFEFGLCEVFRRWMEIKRGIGMAKKIQQNVTNFNIFKNKPYI